MLHFTAWFFGMISMTTLIIFLSLTEGTGVSGFWDVWLFVAMTVSAVISVYAFWLLGKKEEKKDLRRSAQKWAR